MREDDEGTFPISLRVSRCANGETYEYQLIIGPEKVGQPVFLTGNPTAGQRRHALMIALPVLLASIGLHEGEEEGSLRPSSSENF